MAIFGRIKLNPPSGSNKLRNPLKNGEVLRRAKEMHRRNLGKAGVREPRSPLS